MNNSINLNMDQYKNSWKNLSVFKKQLELNKKELSNPPAHWKNLLDTYNTYFSGQNMKLLDIGCGCGAMYQFLADHMPTIIYSGCDYSSEAVSVAKEAWNYQNFFVQDYQKLDNYIAKNYDIAQCIGLFEVLSNGDEAMEFILSLGFKYLFFSKVRLIREASVKKTYTAYDEITTYEYVHNIYHIMDICTKDYKILRLSNIYDNIYSILLERK